MRIKICGITKPNQACAIAQLGATALGFICVSKSPRYVSPEQILIITRALSAGGHQIDRIGVFANADMETIAACVAIAPLTGIQLHGQESPEFCRLLKQRLPHLELIKAFRIRDAEALAITAQFEDVVDTLLLDAYHPNLLGGTGQTLEWSNLRDFNPRRPWLLAGGLTPNNVAIALQCLQPHGIDLSSGIEHQPGDKDLVKVARLFEQIR
jgi:phosphoribosylanthranilate isomerase